MNKVTTTSTCGRCGTTVVREGDLSYERPKGWVIADVGKFQDFLCPPCQDAVLAVLKPVSSGYLTPFPAGYGDEGYQGEAEAPDADTGAYLEAQE